VRQQQQRPIRLFGLTERQLLLVFRIAEPLEPDKRAVLLERLGAHFRLAGRWGKVRDAELEEALRRALAGLQQEPAQAKNSAA
jgi:hypothetical protein